MDSKGRFGNRRDRGWVMPNIRRPKGLNGPNGGANLGFEATLWRSADELRGQVDAAEYKHVVLGLVFLKYISDAFEEHRSAILQSAHADEVEDREAYAPRASSGSPGKRAGPTSRPAPSSRPSGSSSTTRWMLSSETTLR